MSRDMGNCDWTDCQTMITHLPDDCVSRIFSRVGGPKDIVKLALVNRFFYKASRSDNIWEGLLPLRYKEMLSNVVGGPLRYSSKKELYELLCRGVYLDHGIQMVWLDPQTGAICRRLGARSLCVKWDIPGHWRWERQPGSRFKEIARLCNVRWLEVRGQIECYLSPGKYTLIWRIQMAAYSASADARGFHLYRQNYGWFDRPVKFSLVTGDGQQVDTERFLDGELRPRRVQLTLPKLALVLQDEGDWMEYVVGEFEVETQVHAVNLQCSMTCIGSCKQGLLLDGIVIRPSHLVKVPVL